MKLRIEWCPKCNRNTLQAKNKTHRFETETWFCSLCGRDLVDERYCQTKVVPTLDDYKREIADMKGENDRK